MVRTDRFVVPGSKKLELSDGDWIKVKKQLNTGDNRKLDIAGQMPLVKVGDKVMFPIDWSRHDQEVAAIWLTDWSFKDGEGKDVPLSMDAIQALDPATFDEAYVAIVKHSAEVAAERASKKSGPGTQPTPIPGSAT